MATLNVNPDAHPESTTVDGAIHNDTAAATWATIHDASEGQYVSPSETTLYAARLESDADTKYPTMVRSIFLFDVSALPAGATITGVTVGFYGTAVSDGFGSQSLSLVGSTPASDTNVVVGDYDQFGTTKYASDIAFTSLATSQYNIFTMNAAGISYVETAVAADGIVKLGLRLACDVANSAPGGASKVTNFQCYASDNGSNEPYLEITYTPATVDYTMEVTKGEYTLTGVNTEQTKALNIIVSVGQYTLTGINVGLSRGYEIITEATAYVLTGVNIEMTKALNLITEATAYTLTGIDVVLTKGWQMVVSTGSYILTTFSSLFSGFWQYKDEHTSTYTQPSKNTASYTEKTKNTSSWSFKNKINA